MITLLVTLIIIGLIAVFVDKFLLQPYTPPVVRYAILLIVTIMVILLVTNGFGFTHIRLPNN